MIEGSSQHDYVLENATEEVAQMKPGFGCSVLHIVSEALQHSSINAFLFKLLGHFQSDRLGRTDAYERLSDSILSRVRQIHVRHAKRQSPPRYAAANLSFVCKIVSHLTEGRNPSNKGNAMSSSDPAILRAKMGVYQALYKGGYIPLVAQTVVSIIATAYKQECFLKISDNPRDYSSGLPTSLACLRLINDYLITASSAEPPEHFQARFHSIFTHGVLEAAAQATLVWRRFPPTFREKLIKRELDLNLMAAKIVVACGMYSATFPGMVPITHRAITKLSKEHWDALNWTCDLGPGPRETERVSASIFHRFRLGITFNYPSQSMDPSFERIQQLLERRRL
jgi:hypothetical protein